MLATLSDVVTTERKATCRTFSKYFCVELGDFWKNNLLPVVDNL
jgi:hypothetical protein